jgi:hypothetical protein
MTLASRLVLVALLPLDASQQCDGHQRESH